MEKKEQISCKTCRFFSVNPTTGMYICRRYPQPTILQYIDDAWCGEWEKQ